MKIKAFFNNKRNIPVDLKMNKFRSKPKMSSKKIL